MSTIWQDFGVQMGQSLSVVTVKSWWQMPAILSLLTRSNWFWDFAERDELAIIAKIAKDMGLFVSGFEDEISVSYYHRMQTAFKGLELLLKLSLLKPFVWLRTRQRLRLFVGLFHLKTKLSDALDFIKPGKTEIEIANFLDFRMRELGAAGLSFDTILASGINSSKPHAHPMHKPVELGEAITMGFWVPLWPLCQWYDTYHLPRSCQRRTSRNLQHRFEG